VARFDYRDPATGKVLFRQVRQERGSGEKRFRSTPAKAQQEMRRDGSLPLYGEDRLAHARDEGLPVYLVEGEGNADRLNAWAEDQWDGPDLVSVSHCNGAKAWEPFYAPRLAGLDVTVVVDRDAPGQAWAAAVEEDLRGVAKSLRFVQSATAGEHDDIVDHLAAGHGLDDLVAWDPTAPQAAQIDKLVRERMQGLRVDRLARAALAAESWEPPTDLGTLDQQLALDLPEREFVVAELMPVGFNVQLVAQYKTGKTTAALNVARALSDGAPLFGQFAVRHGSRRVAWWNCELDERTALKWLRDMAFAHPERLHVEHLRGYTLNLTDPAVQDWAVTQLQAYDVRTWIIDPFGAVFNGDENSNTDVREWQHAIDAIKRRAGVDNLLLVTHTGHAAEGDGPLRARGATRQMDWADVTWTYRDGGADQPRDRRYLTVERGRDVAPQEVALDFDPETLTLNRVAGAGTRAQHQREALAERAAAVVREYHSIHSKGMPKGALEDGLGAGKTDRKRTAIRDAIERGWIRVEDGPRNSQLHLPGDDTNHIVFRSAKGAEA